VYLLPVIKLNLQQGLANLCPDRHFFTYLQTSGNPKPDLYTQLLPFLKKHRLNEPVGNTLFRMRFIFLFIIALSHQVHGVRIGTILTC